jgi:hypothetical protein
MLLSNKNLTNAAVLCELTSVLGSEGGKKTALSVPTNPVKMLKSYHL